MNSFSDPVGRKKNTDNLFQALEEKNINEIERLIQLDIDWTQTIKSDGCRIAPLQVAARNALWKTVKEIAIILEQKHIPNQQSDDVQIGAAIVRAVRAEQIELVKLLLDNNYTKKSSPQEIIKWSYVDYPNDRATHTAIRQGRADILRLLLDYGYPLAQKNAEGDAIKLAQTLNQSNCLIEIAKHTTLPPTYFSGVSAHQLLTMMLSGIKLSDKGYQHAELQQKRKEVLQAVLALPPEEKLKALNAASDIETLLGDYLIGYQQGFFTGLFNSELSANIFAERIHAAKEAILPKVPTTTTGLFNDLDIEITAGSDEDIELLDNPTTFYSSDDDSFESPSLDFGIETNKDMNYSPTQTRKQ